MGAGASPRSPTRSRTSLIVNLLTEDNLPSYHREIASAFGRDGAWGTWVHRWTAEEGRHGRSHARLPAGHPGRRPGRAGARPDDRQVERDTTPTTAGTRPQLEVIAYVSFQELATRISHRNTGVFTEDPVAERLLARVAADENLHMIFYRDLVAAALELTPSDTVRAIAKEVIGFQMPGLGIADFDRKARKIANAGIYDLRIHHDEVVGPLLRKWGVFGTWRAWDAEAEKARTEGPSP